MRGGAGNAETANGGFAVRRAVWGLVNDGYGLVAKTANLTADEAFELCRVPDIGDPSDYLDDGIAFLRAPKWRNVIAHYYTNAERDSAGRASLVYDVTALDDEAFATVRNDPFVVLPPLPLDRRPERSEELPLVSLTPRGEGGESVRLASLLASEDPETVTTLLAALLAGERVLWIAHGVRAETLECLTLALPPALRPLLTMQRPAIDYPRHTPRLTIAERAHAMLVEREWSMVLPRDASEPRLAAVRPVAERLLALAAEPGRVRRAWEAAGLGAGRAGTPDLRRAVERIVRIDVALEGVRSRDLRRAVLVAGRGDDAVEHDLVAALLLEQAGPDAVAGALADVVRGEQRDAWAATRAVALAVGSRRVTHSAWFDRFFRVLLDRLRDTRTADESPAAREAGVLLVCAAAALDDLEGCLDRADPTLPWESAWRLESAKWVKGRSAAARLFDAIAAKGATYAEAIEAVTALSQSAATLTPAGRRRASALALVLVRRTLHERATLESPERLGALVDALVRLWRDIGPGEGPGADERPFHRLLGVSDGPARVAAGATAGATGGATAGAAAGTAEARRTAAELVRRLEADPVPDGVTGELIGWMVAVIERAHAGALPEQGVRVVTALLEERRRGAADADAATSVGRVMLHLAGRDAALVFRQPWLDLVRQVDAAARRELFARALAWVARGYAAGQFTLGAFVDACAAAGSEGASVDASTATLLAPHLARLAESGRSASELGLVIAAVGGLATSGAAASIADAILAGASRETRDLIRLQRLAGAVDEVERVRDEDAYAEARQALRRSLAGRAPLGVESERTLRSFLGVDDRPVVERLLARVPSLTSERGAVDRRAGGAR